MKSWSADASSAAPSCSLMKPTAQSKTVEKTDLARPSRMYVHFCASSGTVTDSALPCATVVTVRVVSACCSAAGSSPSCPAARSSAARLAGSRLTLDGASFWLSPTPTTPSPMAPKPPGRGVFAGGDESSSSDPKETLPRCSSPAISESIWACTSSDMFIVASALFNSPNSATSSCSLTAITPDVFR